jgi:hypothetical protein
MTLTESLLPKLSEWTPSGAGRHSWAAAFPTEGWTVRIAADKADSLSCLVWELTLSRTKEPPVGLTLKGWATAIAARTSGLLEPLKVHEVDDPRGEALLRSNTPTQKGEALAYYEVKLTGLTTATLRRYSAAKRKTGRNQTAFAITHELLAKVAGDIAG